MKEQCPHCHNVVVGQFKASTTRNILTTVAKKGGTKAILGGVGGPVGFALGVAVDLVAKDHINKFVDNIADEFDDNKVYEFECPNCGHTWTRNEDEFVYNPLVTDYDEEVEEDEDEDEGDDPMASQFDQSLSYLLNETTEIIKSVSEIVEFMHKMNCHAGQSQPYVSAAFHFLAAYAGLIFLKDGEAHSNENKRYIANIAIDEIRKAISLYGLDEYKLIECLLRIQTTDNIVDLLQHLRAATACKVSQGSWLKKEYYQKSLVPDICFFRILEIDRDESVSDEDKVRLWRTLVNTPTKDFRMYANLQVYYNLSDTDNSVGRYLKAAYETKGFSLDRPDMKDPMFEQWLWAAVGYADYLCTGESEIIGKNKTVGMKMLLKIADLGDASPCLSARETLGEIAEDEGDYQKALVYYIKAGEMGAEEAVRLRKLIAENTQSSNTTFPMCGTIQNSL